MGMCGAPRVRHSTATMLPIGRKGDSSVDMSKNAQCTGSSACSECHDCPSDVTICFDPMCTLPTCDEHHLQSALTFGLLPCTHCPPYSLEACANACTLDPCTADCDQALNGDTSLAPAPHHFSSCDASCLAPYEANFAYAQQYLDPCCAACPPLLTVPCNKCLDMPLGAHLGGPMECVDLGSATAACADSHVLPLDPASMETLTSSTGQDSCTACGEARGEPTTSPAPSLGGTPTSTSSSWPHTPRTEGAHHCQWADCRFVAGSMAELAKHVHCTHLRDISKPAEPTSMMPWGDSMKALAETLLPSAENIVPNTPMKHEPVKLHDDVPSSLVPSAPSMDAVSNTFVPNAPSTGALLEEHIDCLCPVEKGKRRHACGWIHCSASFDTHRELTEHITNEHVGSGKNEYECRWVGCPRAAEGRAFSQKQKLLRHIQTHTGDRPYVCPECKKRFSESNTLTQHMRTHTNERPYKCDFPGCNKSFNIIGSLTIHKRVHTGDRPFRCPVPGCDKAFSESSNLNKHLRVHRGIRPVECPDCGRQFARVGQMQRHRRQHARDQATAPAAAPAAEAAVVPAISTPNSALASAAVPSG